MNYTWLSVYFNSGVQGSPVWYNHIKYTTINLREVCKDSYGVPKDRCGLGIFPFIFHLVLSML